MEFGVDDRPITPVEEFGKNHVSNYVSLIHWVGRGTGTPKDKDEVNKRQVCECEGVRVV